MYEPGLSMDEAQTNATWSTDTPAISAAKSVVRAAGVTSSQSVDMRMFPWLLPVSVAVVMVIFLVCSFWHHHRRFLQQRRHASRYIIHEYRRVAGPIFSLAATLNDATTTSDGKGTCGDGGGEQDDQPTSILTPNALTKRLRRCYSWSPRIFKTKHLHGPRNTGNNSAGLSAVKKCAHELNSRNSLGSTGHGLVPASPRSPGDPSLPTWVLQEIQALQKTSGLSEEKLNHQLSALAHWATFSQSTRRKSRSLVVTTSTGALATDQGCSEPDVTRLGRGGNQAGSATGGDTDQAFVVENGIRSTHNKILSEVNVPQTVGQEYSDKNHPNESHGFDHKTINEQRVLFPGIPLGKSNARMNFFQYPVDETSRCGREHSASTDTVPTIQITPTTEEAGAEWNTSVYTSTGMSDKNNTPALCLDVNTGTYDLIPPAYHEGSMRIPVAPVQPLGMSRHRETAINPFLVTQNQFSAQLNSDRSNTRPFNVVDREKDSLDMQEDESKTNSNALQQENSDTVGVYSKPILKDLFEIYRVVRALRETLLPRSNHLDSESTDIGETNDGNTWHGVEVSMIANKAIYSAGLSSFKDDTEMQAQSHNDCDGVNSSFDVADSEGVSKLKRNNISRNSDRHRKSNIDQNSCSRCTAVKEILISLGNLNLHNIEQFLLQAMVKPTSGGVEANGPSFSTLQPRDNSSLPTQRDHGDDSYETPLLLNRRRAASDSSTIPESHPLLSYKDGDGTFYTSVFENTCRVKCRYEWPNNDHSNVTNIQDSLNTAIMDTTPALSRTIERKEPSGQEDDVIGYRSLSDSPKSCDSVRDYMDSSLSSLYESLV
ncbi:hypothetical protein EGW08_004642 [Elysia chlorotica]|uniref:Uncharacterized protein n=1 Tax=Elysia chlorotica TaxID=188477 RepID=A0A433U1C4_ELYCH|nr:hypothetical protein EGW08_004642 [Elysia chlorotica]